MIEDVSTYELIIIGSGPAGLSAGLYAARANLSVAIFEGPSPKGQLMTTASIENYPGFIDEDAHQLMSIMSQQAQNVGCTLIQETVEKIEPLGTKKIRIHTSNKIYTCQAVILATGAKAKYLGLESEVEYMGYGVSTCATCDGSFFKNLEVAVIGGGNTAIEEVIYLSKIASHVHLIHRREIFRAEPIMQDRMMQLTNVSLHLNYTLQEIVGTQKPKLVKSINILHKDGDTKNIPLQGVFIAIGHTPQTELVKDLIELDTDGYALATGVSTKVPGLFVAGDVVDKVYRQAITSAGQGCMASMEAIKFLQ
ncbi:MAG: thioredoxin-disulfide reductase [Alphaproteobacteria bacterium]|nr:MAG: thioredoxin-disulfide reductase [Alphaproteobacteria bacterium]